MRNVQKKTKAEACCETQGEGIGRCRVESLLSVDDRGQMVLPKEMRERAGIRPGDKLALVSWEREGRVCCFTLIKAEELDGMVRGVIGPLMGGLIGKTPE